MPNSIDVTINEYITIMISPKIHLHIFMGLIKNNIYTTQSLTADIYLNRPRDYGINDV